MTLPVQNHLARLVGSYNGRPLYAVVCDPPDAGYNLTRLTGSYNGRPVYLKAECEVSTTGGGYLPTGYYRARLVGQRNGRPLYVMACCGPSGSGSASLDDVSRSRSASESASLSPSASASSGSVASSSGSEMPSAPGSVPGSGSTTASLLSGSSGTRGSVFVRCCGDPVSTVLAIVFSGSLAPVGVVILTWVEGSRAWEGNGGGVCNIGVIRFECVDPSFAVSLGPAASCAPSPAVSCNPFYWTCSGNSFGACTGVFTAEVVAL